MQVPLEIILLGGCVLRVGDAPALTPGSARLQALVGQLALAPGGALSRQAVADALWPDAPDAQARNSLRQLLHQLRQAWQDHDQWMTIDDRRLAFMPDRVRVDVLAFEAAIAQAQTTWQARDRAAARAALERAAAAYQGPLLPACADDWVIARRERLQRAAVQAIGLLARLDEEARDIPAAIATAERVLAVDPVNEEGYLRLMRLHAQARDRAAILRVYDACVQTLRRELDIAPSPEVAETFRRLSRRSAAATPGTPEPLSAAPFVGRDAEWRVLIGLWEQCTPGRSMLAITSGEPGIGKTRLGEELLGWADARGIATARARAYEAEGRLALAPITALVRSDAIAPAVAQLEPVWRTEIARLCPELLVADPSLPPPMPLAEYGQRQRFFEALARGVTGAAQSLMLLLDDLQWCDADTLEWLRYLLRFESPGRLLVVATARDEALAPDHPLHQLRAALGASGQLVDLPLGPLDAAETSNLAAAVGGSQLAVDEAVRLFRETAGNPLFVVETVRAGSPATVPADSAAAASVLPPRVLAVITGRLQQLSDDARELAGVAAIVGRAFTAGLLHQASGFSEERTMRALDELWQRRLVREAPAEDVADAYDFAHDTLRDVAASLLSPVQRRHWHRRLAEALAAADHADSATLSARIATHFEQAGQPGRALPYLERATQDALRLFAYDDAIALLRRLLAIAGAERDPRARAERELHAQLQLSAALRVSRGWASPELEPVLARVLELSREVGDAEQQAAALATSLFFHEVRSDHDVVIKLIGEATTSIDAVASPPIRVISAVARLGACSLRGEFVESERIYQESAGWYDRSQHARHVSLTGADFGVLQRAWSAHGLWALGRPGDARARVGEALALARDLAHPFSEALALAYEAMLEQIDGDRAACARAAAAALAVSERHRVIYYAAWSRILLAWVEGAAAPTAEASALLRARIEAFVETGARARLPYYLTLLADIERRCGEFHAALRTLDEALAVSRAQGELWWNAEVHRLRAAALGTLGRADDAERSVEEGLAIARRQQAPAFEARLLSPA